MACESSVSKIWTSLCYLVSMGLNVGKPFIPSRMFFSCVSVKVPSLKIALTVVVSAYHFVHSVVCLFGGFGPLLENKSLLPLQMQTLHQPHWPSPLVVGWEHNPQAQELSNKKWECTILTITMWPSNVQKINIIIFIIHKYQL